MITDSFAYDAASSLYDGGWRADDLDELMQVYGFPREDAEKICSHLKDMEDANN